MHWQEHITVDSSVLVGKPIIRGTRIAVEFIVGLYAAGWTAEQILEDYPHLSINDLHAALAYAAERLQSEKLYPLSV